MSYSAKVVADSIAEGVRLTSLEVTFPRYILAEFNTHRVFSRNSASSRAIPVKTRVKQVRENPFVPEFTKNKKGMSADESLIDDAARNATAFWVSASRMAADMAESLAHIEVHKQQANRLLEPFAWHTVLVTSTWWQNFWNLRIHVSASPEMYRTAQVMREAIEKSRPRELGVGQWHLPLVPDADDILKEEELRGWTTTDHNLLVRVSVARCAAISYERQHAKKDIVELVERHDGMQHAGHWSPFEHQARVASQEEILKNAYYRWNDDLKCFEPVCIGNLQVPWFQYRKMIPGEDVFRG